MIRYILECMAFQLLFLIVYDLFLKRETFFQWNRLYLIGTFVLSLLLPWIKIEAFKTTAPSGYIVYPEYVWGMDMSTGAVVSPKTPSVLDLSPTGIVFYGGMLIAAVLFMYKLYQINRLKRQGKIRYFKDYTRVVVHNSTMAFSFFRSIFLGDRVLEKEHKSIIQHELVHIGQRHSWDLMFFELMRIIGWFNPLVYVYQNRISELHEFIADAKVAKTHKKEQYQLLLSQVFQTQHISFINPFFKSSLIKKRIVMLQKSKSKKIWQLKYLLLLPLVVGMLAYTSCETETKTETVIEVADQTVMETVGKTQMMGEVVVTALSTVPSKLKFASEEEIAEIPFEATSGEVLFSAIDEVPVFPGCENAEDKRGCFVEQVQRHISKNFRYPEQAVDKGTQGTVLTVFTIDEKGNVVNIKKRGPSTSLEAEVERIISKLPKMKGGKHGAKEAKVLYSIPITFRLR